MSSPGVWTSLDGVSWNCAALFCAIWFMPLALETYLGHQKSFQWRIIYLAILINFIKSVTILVYNSNSTDLNYRIYKIFDWWTYLLGDISLYYRKRAICPAKDYEILKLFGYPIVVSMDSFFILYGLIFTTTAKTACLIGQAGSCWVIEGNFVFASTSVTSFYFDIYFLYCLFEIAWQNKKVSIKPVLRLCVPVIWTLSATIMYFQGSLLYQFGNGNFWSNAYWNFGSVVYPLLCIQSCVSSNASVFVLEAKRAPSSKKEGTVRKMSVKGGSAAR